MAEQALKTIIVDGLSVITTDAGAQAIDKLNGVIAAAAAKAVVDAKALSDAKAATDTKDGEIAALKKQLDDAKVTPAQLDAAVAARSQVIADARKIAGDKLVTDGKTDADIRRDAVATKLDAAAVKAMSDDAVAGAFVAFTPKVDGNAPLRDALSNIQTSDARAAATASWEKNKADLNNAWKGKAS